MGLRICKYLRIGFSNTNQNLYNLSNQITSRNLVIKLIRGTVFWGPTEVYLHDGFPMVTILKLEYIIRYKLNMTIYNIYKH